MTVTRHSPPVAITTIPRSTLEHTCHREIDAILKDLKLCSRGLKSALDAFKHELRTLERLYYKCKNQHRAALFFKRVPEMKRYGRRLSELDILERVDLLRASFVDLAHTNNHNVLRNSWSHVPEKPYVCFLTERLTAYSALVCKVRERLENAYHHFSLAMQTGAFVQLIVLFVAMASRMSVLASQLDDALQLGILTCNRLLVIIHPTGTHATISEQLPLRPETSRPSRIDHDLLLEVMEKPVSRSEQIDTSVIVFEDQSTKAETALQMCTSRSSSHRIEVDDHTNAVQVAGQASQKITTKGAQGSRQKKSKKKFDEIDEIFGF